MVVVRGGGVRGIVVMMVRGSGCEGEWWLCCAEVIVVKVSGEPARGEGRCGKKRELRKKKRTGEEKKRTAERNRNGEKRNRRKKNRRKTGKNWRKKKRDIRRKLKNLEKKGELEGIRMGKKKLGRRCENWEDNRNWGEKYWEKKRTGEKKNLDKGERGKKKVEQNRTGGKMENRRRGWLRC